MHNVILANNAKCNMACIKNGCQAGFVNQFSTAPGVPIVNCTCAICLPNQRKFKIVHKFKIEQLI